MFFIGIALAILVAALSGMGVGGGGLLVIWLVLVMQMPSHTAQGINLLFFTVSAAASLFVHLRLRTFPVRRLLFLTITAIPGVFIGCQLASHLPEAYMRRIFGWFLLLSGAMQIGRRLRCHFSLDYQNKS